MMAEALGLVSKWSSYLIPLLMGIVGCFMLWGKRPYFDAFVTGAGEGLKTAVKLCPTLTALLVAIGMLNASGAVGMLGEWLSPLFSALGVPGGNNSSL